jgi:hypothetical protein
VEDDGSPAITLVPLEAIDAVVPQLMRLHCRIDITIARSNVSMTYRHPLLASLMRAFTNAARRGRMRRGYIRKVWNLAGLQKEGNPLSEALAADPIVRRFVEDYYARDFLLHERACLAFSEERGRAAAS